jgi:hypothetical protein
LLCAVALLTFLLTLARPLGTRAEGSGSLFPATTSTAFRANLEWRTTFYGSSDSPTFNIFRRTLVKLYAEAGERILVGSSGVGVRGTPDRGDVRVYPPGVVTGAIGDERIPALQGTPPPRAPGFPLPTPGTFANGFSCVSQRATPGNDARGRIDSRDAELAGPDTENGLVPDGYQPCIYVAPTTGIYDVVFIGPSGFGSNDNAVVSGQVLPTDRDFGPNQRSSVTAWDVSVRKDPNQVAVERGRAFVYYFAGNTGGGGRNTAANGLVVTDYGFIYRVGYSADPFGFIVYSNQFGFRDSDGSPLYHALLADPDASTQDQNELKELQGGVELLPPEYPIFLDLPAPNALDALGIPRQPVVPAIASMRYASPRGDDSSLVGEGGTFTFQTNQAGVYVVTLSRDGSDFSASNPRNRIIRGVADSAGALSVQWDGNDNSGEPFPVGEYFARAFLQGSEAHFPFLDVENNLTGGPVIELLNPPDLDGDGVGDCPPWEGGCFGAFYDDGGYVTANGTLVGTSVGGPLCPGAGGNPPRVLASDPERGYDTRTDQRAFGFPFDANPERICRPDGGYGDKKALDLWTYYPSNRLQVPLRIVDQPTAVTLRNFSGTATAEGVSLRWETGVELHSAGFHLLRAEGDDRAQAVRVTAALIAARGSASEGASYSYLDATARPGIVYHYWLEEHELSGNTNIYGPARIGATTASLVPRVWLPFVR